MNQLKLRAADDAELEIERLEQELMRLKRHVEAQRSAAFFGGFSGPPKVRAILRARRARDELISRELFADPAWDMLLELYAADLEQRRVSTSELCIASAVPATTALRWIERLAGLNLIERENDSLDGRRVWVALSPAGRDRMESYFEALPAAFRSV